KGKQALKAAGLHYISALTDPQIRRLLGAGTLQLGLFSEDVCEVEAEGVHYLLRKNEAEYVVVSDVPKPQLRGQEVHDSYVSLQKVERDFRQLKTGLLEVRPIWVRKESCTRGHVFGCMFGAQDQPGDGAPAASEVRDDRQRSPHHYPPGCLGRPEPSVPAGIPDR
ncbi:MAG: hypothetical protein AAB225_22175, partial [Acidobacteriota bacterium]